MPSIALAASSRPRRRWPWILSILVLLSLVVYRFVLWRCAVGLETALAEYRGPSLHFRDYLPPPLPSEAPNGWHILEKTLVRLEGTADPDASPKPDPDMVEIRKTLARLEQSGQRPDSEDLDRFRQILGRLGPTLELLDRPLLEVEAAQLLEGPDASPIDYELPHILGILRIAGLLEARAAIALAEGRGDAAAEDLVRLFGLADWTSRLAPGVVGAVSAEKICREIDQVLAPWLGSGRLDGPRRARIAAMARRLDPRLRMDQAIGFQWAMTYSSVIDPRFAFATREGKSNGWFARLPFWRPWYLWNAEVLVERYGAAWSGSRRPAYLRGDQLARLGERGLPRFAILARVLLFAADEKEFQRRDLWAASFDMREIGFALEDFRDLHGRYPARLSELDAESAKAIDPFSGEAYRYRPQEDRYRLYSVGPNRRDDGGGRGFDQQGKLDRDQGDWIWPVGERNRAQEGSR